MLGVDADKLDRGGITYVIGPLRGNRELNIAKARKVAQWLWKQGFVVYCPHTNSGDMADEVAEDVLMKGSLAILQMCKRAVVLPRWENSEGSREEIKTARECGMPLYYVYNDLKLILERA